MRPHGQEGRERARSQAVAQRAENGYGVVPEQRTEFKYGNGYKGGCINREPVLGAVPVRYK
jgi:hypothetical protein